MKTKLLLAIFFFLSAVSLKAQHERTGFDLDAILKVEMQKKKNENSGLQKTSAITSIVSLLDSTYYWNSETSGTLDTIYKIIYEYDANYNVLLAIGEVPNGVDWQNSSQDVYTYDANNNQTSDLFQYWNGSVWYTFKQTLHTYDLNNNLTFYSYKDAGGGQQYFYTYDVNNDCIHTLTQNWNTTSLSWVNGGQRDDTYNGFHKMITDFHQTWNTGTGIWVNNSQYFAFYDVSNNKQQEYWQTWTGSTWNNTTRYSYTYDANNNMLTKLYENGSGSSWVNSQNFINTYDANNDMITSLIQGWSSGAWDGGTIENYTYNTTHEIVHQVTQNWTGSSWQDYAYYDAGYDAAGLKTDEYRSYQSLVDGWIDDYSRSWAFDVNENMVYHSDYDYDDGGILWNWRSDYYTYDADNNKITQKGTYKSGQDPVYNDSTHYYYHNVFVSTSIAENTKFEMGIYPNPTTGQFTIQSTTQPLSNSTIFIYNTLGEKVYSQTNLNCASCIVNCAFPQGIYFVKVSDGEKMYTQKLIIQ